MSDAARLADVRMATLARELAQALAARARERTVACNIKVAELQTALCAAWRNEQQQRFAALPLDDDE